MIYNVTFDREEVAITNLRNMDFTFEYVDGSKDLQNKIEKFVGKSDYQLEYMGGELRGLATNYIQSCYQLAEETNTPLWVISNLFDTYYCLQDVKRIVEENRYTIYEESNQLNVIEQYVEDMGILEGVPENIKTYFDYKQYKRDMELGGDITIIDTDTYNEHYQCIYILVKNY